MWLSNTNACQPIFIPTIESRLYFKDSVNKLADVVTDNNAKFLVLKHDQYFCSDDSPVQETKPFEPVLRKHHAPPVPAIMQPNIPQRARPMSVSDNEARGYTNKSIPPANIQDNRKVYQPAPPYNAHKHSNQNLPLHSVNNGNQQLMSQQTTYNAVAVNWSPLQQADQPPQPPPRRRTSSNSGLSGSSFATKHGNVDEKVVQLHEGDHLEKVSTFAATKPAKAMRKHGLLSKCYELTVICTNIFITA